MNKDIEIVSEGRQIPQKTMRGILETLGVGYEWYKIRRAEYETSQRIPFLVAPAPLYLTGEESREISSIGMDVVDFMHAADELYRSEYEVKELLDRGKPKVFEGLLPHYLFVRPDLIITQQGFAICEIETSPFGLALAELLNRAYHSTDFDTLVPQGILKEFLTKNTPNNGTIVYSHKTSSYAGQLQFLARELLSGDGREWHAEQADYVTETDDAALYRGFYLYEYFSDIFVNHIVNAYLKDQAGLAIPSLTPYMEEKALLAFIWDKRREPFLKGQLGMPTLEHLRRVVPPTWVVGQEQFFVLGLPEGISSSEGLAGLSKSRRKFVLKKSGFGNNSSWGEGVSFLQEKSARQARNLLVAASQDPQSVYVIQEFKPSLEYPMAYDKDGYGIEQMQARIRLTPYFSMTEARLIAIKATGCEDTNYIHASTGSINTAVAVA